MTRKHFRALAKSLKESYPNTNVCIIKACQGYELARWKELVRSIADIYSEANPNFNYSTFKEACLPEGEEW